MLTPTQPAPLTIAALDENDHPISLQDTLGQYVVLYFYPKDDTPGCTTEACSFRDANTELTELGVRVIGVSRDSVESHARFKEKYHLPFELWSDPERKLIEAFGAWGEKKRFGKISLGVMRSTFVIDPQGNIIKVWKSVKPEGHSEQVLKFLRPLLAEK